MLTSHGTATPDPSVPICPSSWRLPPEYLVMLEQDGHHNAPAFLHSAVRLFDGRALQGKRILEIGSGRGLLSILMALGGAARVVSIEPELVGSRSGVIALQRERAQSLGLDNLEVVAADFNTWDPPHDRFDIILSRASINHLYESAKHALHDGPTYENYLRTAGKIRGLLEDGGIFIATDACRYAFFTGLRDLGIRRPWRWKKSKVNWRYHQNPGTWTRIFRDAGFSDVQVAYPVPYRLRKFAPIVDSTVANFFLKGSFILRATR